MVESDSGAVSNGLIRGRQLKPLVGDEVVYSVGDDGTWVIERILPRRSVLERIDARGRAEGIAANLSLLVIVIAPEPAPDWQLVDRYLAAAALLGIRAAIVLSKSDLAEAAAVGDHARLYRRIGYPLFEASAVDGRGLAELESLLAGHRGVLLGQSGVGKSSLLNALIGSEAQAVQSLSRRRAIGRHTTTAAVLHRLASGGELIDSPGVRRYAPCIADAATIDRGFIEFAPHLGHCRFNDCRHAAEPGCAVRQAVADGAIDPARHRSYLALRETIERFA